MLIVLDNMEPFLDPQGTDIQGTYSLVDGLGRFKNICICITSRITPAPLRCEHLDIPTLSMGAALDTFYRIYDTDDRSDIVSGILEELDFHPLSVTLLATVAHQSEWDPNRLAREWEKQRMSVLQTDHSKSLTATIYSITVYCDNRSAIELVKNTTFHSRTKHIAIHFHCVGNIANHRYDQLELTHSPTICKRHPTTFPEQLIHKRLVDFHLSVIFRQYVLLKCFGYSL